MSIPDPCADSVTDSGQGVTSRFAATIYLLSRNYVTGQLCLTALPARYYSDWWDHTISKFKFLLWWEIAHQFISVQSLSCVQLFATPWTAARQASLSISNSWSLIKFMSIELVMPSNHLVLCCPLLLLPSIFHSIRVFANELALCIRWPKYWSFSFSISPSKEYSGLIAFKIDWLDFLAVQGTLKSLLQHHSSKASVLWCSAFCTVQLSHPNMSTGKTIALAQQTFVGKVMSQLFNNMLSRLVIAFLPRSKCHLIPFNFMRFTFLPFLLTVVILCFFIFFFLNYLERIP